MGTCRVRSPALTTVPNIMPERRSSIQADTPFVGGLVNTLKRHPKRIVFPEGNDLRVLHVAEKLVELEVVVPILLGDVVAIRKAAEENGVKMDFIRVIDPEKSSDFGLFCDRFQNMERFRKLDIDDPRPTMAKPHYFASMMVQYGQADAVVGGNQTYAAGLFRAFFHMIKPLPGIGSVAAATVMECPGNPCFGENGVLFLADCAVIQEPTLDQLAMIAVESAKLASLFLGRPPKVAMLSFSNKSSAEAASSKKMAAAAVLARERAKKEMVEMEVDGELQVDVALMPEISEAKCGDNRIHGQADILVFPDLNAGHIARKLLQYAAAAQPYGQLLLGLSRPAAQVSRVSDEQKIFGTALAAGIRAIHYRELIEAENGG